ncbi:uncharacterized protein MONOS_4061 [Monocercomonoides exilis]|uniref:uncharacterized protein n=1 Tax=Monocercomonoides exilis TaxID=2049356 RepID=UPI00355ABD7E|nr:hypothetical protein MONOS_4061 [Monocercomonoides exilis]|eukprot:MONOS_4061.1-p1 / transcript=MONOS_4061.1 / gene=MONOS_4061 / organism=Monocercomonoides_exilis_PA203 / gene_product=unspecified product / transcript_product=unspecified product / location=Mono_scaffold00103:56339-57263(+) / protein_length=234 / sequence_SO=supercontig / SO=protein_coding / is_pseudo=false
MIAFLFLISQYFCEEQKNVLLTYFSYTNTTKILAESIANQIRESSNNKLNLTVQQLHVESIPLGWKQSLGLYWNSFRGKDSMHVKELNQDLTSYDAVMVGAPVWWYGTACPVIHWAQTAKIDHLRTKFFFFNMAGGSGNERAFTHLASTMHVTPLETLGITTKTTSPDFLVAQYVNNCLKQLGALSASPLNSQGDKAGEESNEIKNELKKGVEQSKKQIKETFKADPSGKTEEL